MAKLAVILFLFALCAVAMAGRIAREEPTQKPVNALQDQFKTLTDQFQQFLQNPDLKKSLESFANNIQEATKQFTDKLQTQASGATKA